MNISCCPNCGSEDGYIQPITEKYNLNFSYRYPDENDCSESLITAGRYRCMSCRKVIPKRLIEGDQ